MHNKQKKNSSYLSRRSFINRSLGAAGVLAFPTIIPASALGKDGHVAPSERVRIGLLGCGNRASYGEVPAYARMADVQVTQLVDPFPARREHFKAEWFHDARQSSDFREIWDDVDAVHISAGDYWHVPMALLAARAGKHVYIEKPLGLSIEQCLACREILEEHPELQIQYGTQGRSSFNVWGAVDMTLYGLIGEVKEIYNWCPPGLSGGSCEPIEPPAGWDRDMWFGPAPLAPYCEDRCGAGNKARNGIFHIYDYSIGFLSGWGAHPLEHCQAYLEQIGQTIPVEVHATGQLPSEGLFDTLLHWDAEFRYENGMTSRFCDDTSIRKHLPKLEGIDPSINHGTVLIGTEGWVQYNRFMIKASNRELIRKIRKGGYKPILPRGKGAHSRNFVDAILGKNQITAPLDAAIHSDIATHLVDLSVRHGSPLKWDNQAMTITNNAAAKANMQRAMRGPWNEVLNTKYT
jgi:predicted dehydrogenase